MAYEYRVLGKPVRLDVDPTVVAVRFEEPAPNSTRARATAAAGVGPFATRFEIPGEKLTIVPAGAVGLGHADAAGPSAAIDALNRQPEVRNALPVFRVNGNQVVASDRVIVAFKDTPTFNGTSSATPLVAGACGLVLSANSGLTEARVRELICTSADKVGPYPYTGGRNDYFGFGRLNVLAAVEAARQLA